MGGGSGVAVPRLSKRLAVEITSSDSLQNQFRDASMNVVSLVTPECSKNLSTAQQIFSPQKHHQQVSSNCVNLLCTNLLTTTPRFLSVSSEGNVREGNILPLGGVDAGKGMIYSDSYDANENQDLFMRTRPKQLRSSFSPYIGTSVVHSMPLHNSTSAVTASNIQMAVSPVEHGKHMEKCTVPTLGYSPPCTIGESRNMLNNGKMILVQGKANGDVNAAAEPSPKGKSISIRARSQTTDRIRRIKISEGIKALQDIIPYAKGDKDAVLDNVIEYIKFLKLQLKLLSENRLCGEVTPYPFVHLEGYGHYLLHQQMSSEPLEDMMGQLMEMNLVDASKLVESKGLTFLPMSTAYSLLKTI